MHKRFLKNHKLVKLLWATVLSYALLASYTLKNLTITVRGWYIIWGGDQWLYSKVASVSDELVDSPSKHMPDRF
ncbi:hypothetical protein VNO77_04137 [Canavalia gladiata]|uniref:Uncharacterized protein n=1 Tax=Canavalia gladiata TaxID=3824 RepID=A0AAN9MW38_CANGL